MFHGHAAYQSKGKLLPHQYIPKPLPPNEVEIHISHCGLCHSDIHLIDNDWLFSKYPFIPGHEIIGTVTAAGARVNGLKKGTRVGVGWQSGACFKCAYCNGGEENFCASEQGTCLGRNGGFADKIRLDGRFAFPIPKALSSAEAAPLMCAGITVFSPLVSFGVKPGSRVGVIGIGGLGHLAIQFAAKMGCRVTAFSTSASKKKEAKKWGARDFVCLKGKNALKKSAASFDFILSTVPADLDWRAVVGMLRPKGRLCFVGVPDKPLNIPIFTIIDGQKSVSGSPIGNRRMIKRMLDFAARHRVRARVETLPMKKVNEAIQRLRENKARYRMVLEN